MNKIQKYNLCGDEFDINQSIIVGRKAYDIGVRVVKWTEQQGYDGYIRPLRVSPRRNSVDNIKQLLIHHTGQDRVDPSTMYNVLWNQRKLSVHFAIDEFRKPVCGLGEGAVVWQFCDCDWTARHAGLMNKTSIGVEVCHFPSAWKKENYYNEKRNLIKNNVRHEIKKQQVFSKKRDVFMFTENVVDALARLYAGCWFAIGHQRKEGNVGVYGKAPIFPRINNEIPWDKIKNPKNHEGLIAHRHCSKNKWDPAGLDFFDFEKAVKYYYDSFRYAFYLSY